MELGRFDPTYSSELLKHMDKQNEILMEAYRSMLHESQKLQVEEEMLMHKLYEVMSAHGLIKKAASAVASATMTPLTVEAPPNKLLVLVAKVLFLILLSCCYLEKDDVFKGTLSSPFCDLGALVLPTHPGATIIDFRSNLHDSSHSKKRFESF
ncbi:cleavage stimulation factor subunit 50-like isoform X3 [Arachis ipaensis]|uniref:cleavage stimulation factor subunit 50-like isoform X3 n=1 Tax=Arachis ipaensis TaxID=130454 RepID=UPI000A2B7A29|nr:cleavage stimulation factor subunit 50-like isoform X3 [Arachis ipaensis]XP_020966460.1 cleavage stimulation factor subunit 50-like isoform X3 [Arachis ipaensis]